ncbi:MAG: acyltransferase family protein [Leucobacter sp.]
MSTDTSKFVLRRPRSVYMHEVDGIRGIALTLVVLFHIFGNGRVSGGVDVFLVISAYFLTRKLLNRLNASGPFRPSLRAQAGWLGRHYGGVVSRLVPSAAVVLLAVLIATRLFSQPSQYPQNLRETIASALYYENWELIFSQLAYEAAGPATSPLQHFWSLSVQGQFFLVWPVLLFAVFLLAARLTGSYRAILLGLISTLTLASFVYALYLVSADQQVAYFSSLTRFWELGAGALIAFVPPSFLARNWVREGAVWVGIAMIVLSGFLFDGAALFPGIATLWPVGGTLIALFGASRRARHGFASALLSTRPVQYLAKISYQLYLWHWPILIFTVQASGADRVSFAGAVFVLLLSFALAAATQWLVSRRRTAPKRMATRRMPQLRRMLVPALLTCAVLGIAATWGFGIDRNRQAVTASVVEHQNDYIGAVARTDPEAASKISTEVLPQPALDIAPRDQPAVHQQGCIQSMRDEPRFGEVLVCDEDDYRQAGRAGDSESGTGKTVVITGGSHAVQWYPALQQMAEQQHWRLVVIAKNACRLTTQSDSPTCAQWNSQVVDVIASYTPDLVFTLGSVSQLGPGSLDYVDPRSVEVWQQFEDRGIPVVGVRDTPRLPFKVPECLEQNRDDPDLCRYPRSDIYDPEVLSAVDGLPGSFHFIDLSDIVTGPEYFEPIVGNVVVYRDSTHLTATYAATTTPMLESAIREAIPALFGE